MKIKIKLSIMMIAIVLVVAGGIAIIELQKSSTITKDLAEQKTMYLARQRAEYWDGRLNGYINVLQTLSNIFNFYENLPVAERRKTYEETLQSVFEDMPDFVRLGTIWKPNAIDGQDARNIGRVGSTATGQFAFNLTRETGQIVALTSGVVQETMAIMNGPNGKVVSMSDPAPFHNQGKDTYAVRITVPVINKRLNDVVAAVVCQLDIAMIQPRIEQTIKDFDEVTSMVIYSDNGFILGNYIPAMIGKTIAEETQFGKYLKEATEAIKNAKEYSCFAYDPEMHENFQIAIANIPIGASPTTWSVMIGSTETYIMKDVNALKNFVIILASIAIVVAVVIIYIVLGNTTAPIVRVSDTLRDISEGEGDLTDTAQDRADNQRLR